MKKSAKLLACLLLILSVSSCYTYTTVVGTGAQGNQETTLWNNYFIYGLVPGNVSDPAVLAGGAKNYTVVTEMTFVNGLITALTFGIFAPTTTKVIK